VCLGLTTSREIISNLQVSVSRIAEYRVRRSVPVCHRSVWGAEIRGWRGRARKRERAVGGEVVLKGKDVGAAKHIRSPIRHER
jgi:hypothetical protein